MGVFSIHKIADLHISRVKQVPLNLESWICTWNGYFSTNTNFFGGGIKEKTKRVDKILNARARTCSLLHRKEFQVKYFSAALVLRVQIFNLSLLRDEAGSLVKKTKYYKIFSSTVFRNSDIMSGSTSAWEAQSDNRFRIKFSTIIHHSQPSQ